MAVSISKQQQWQNILEQFYASGLSQREFCKQSGLSLASFNQWKRKLELTSEETFSPSFVAVSVNEQANKSDLIQATSFSTIELGALKLHIPNEQLPLVLEVLMKNAKRI